MENLRKVFIDNKVLFYKKKTVDKQNFVKRNK